MGEEATQRGSGRAQAEGGGGGGGAGQGDLLPFFGTQPNQILCRNSGL